jgi:polyisoprenoid-binding protein YceI
MSATTSLQPLDGAYDSDPIHSSFGFALRYMGVSTFRGTLDDVVATLTAGPAGVALQGVAKIESISITTPDKFRQHVLAPDFFDAAAYPEISFRSTKVELAPDGRATVDGELTIKGSTQPVHAEGTWSPEAETFSGRRAHLGVTTTIDRTAFGVGWNADLPNGSKALSDDVELTIDLALLAQDQGQE